jgi:hypothetical protein
MAVDYASYLEATDLSRAFAGACLVGPITQGGCDSIISFGLDTMDRTWMPNRSKASCYGQDQATSTGGSENMIDAIC